MDRLALGYHLGPALRGTIRLNASQWCRSVYMVGDPTLRAYVAAPVTLTGNTSFSIGADPTKKTYAVRALKLEATGAGSFNNLSQAVKDTHP